MSFPQVALMIGVHVVGDILVSSEKDACDKFLKELRQRFPVRKQGELRMYTTYASVRDWE